MTHFDILAEEFELLRLDLILKYNEKGMRASGNFAETLENTLTEKGIKLTGENYAQQLETGRKAGKFPPISVIEKWIEDKGLMLKIQGNISKSSLAFLIARKISRDGWKREDYGGVELISEVVTEKRINEIVKRCGDYFQKDFITDIIFLLQNDNVSN